jgi:hypothetical protein
MNIRLGAGAIKAGAASLHGSGWTNKIRLQSMQRMLVKGTVSRDFRPSVFFTNQVSLGH